MRFFYGDGEEQSLACQFIYLFLCSPGLLHQFFFGELHILAAGGQGAQESLPILRDLDGYLYVRHYRGRYLVGAFEPRGKPRSPDSIAGTGAGLF